MEGKRKTIYLKAEDLRVWDAARDKWGGSISSLIAFLLRRYAADEMRPRIELKDEAIVLGAILERLTEIAPREAFSARQWQLIAEAARDARKSITEEEIDNLEFYRQQSDKERIDEAAKVVRDFAESPEDGGP